MKRTFILSFKFTTLSSTATLAVIAVLLASASIVKSSTDSGRRIDTQYATMTVSRGWTVVNSEGSTLVLKKGNYILTIDPIFTHASGVIGGRFYEVTKEMSSVRLVMGTMDGPPGPWECAQWPAPEIAITTKISLQNLYTDNSKRGTGCRFPRKRKPAWFGAYSSGGTELFGSPNEGEYAITLDYQAANADGLPRQGSSELRSSLNEVAAMLKTLQLKAPVTISKIEPQSGPPGATITVYGSGFDMHEAVTSVGFTDFPNDPRPEPVIASDGQSLTFQVLTSTIAISCYDIGNKYFCPHRVVNGTDLDKLCPQLNHVRGNFCGIAIPPGSYQVVVNAGGVASNPWPFTVTAPEPSAVSISVVYPDYLVEPGNLITVRGSGFASADNRVRVGSVVVNRVPSSDGKTIIFEAPVPDDRSSLISSIGVYEISVSNANGESNSISLWYH
jgi:IPT/TIG domain